MIATVMKRFILAGLVCSASIAGQAMAQDPGDSSSTSSSDNTTLQEIVVTATRREAAIDTIPISISAFSRQEMDLRGIKTIDDVARSTPGLNFAPVGDRTLNSIAIRGILSTIGASTTGIYIDDVPIQVRYRGFITQHAYPQIFDLERVEVLKGPQGTLFGTGSMGGTIRFITPEPDLYEHSLYSRVEGSNTVSGDPSYEVGVAGGGPLVDGTLGARASVFYQSMGGFVNQKPFTGTVVTDKGHNDSHTTVARGAVKWALSDALTVTPTIYYQKKHENDNFFWLNESDPDHTNFNTGFTLAEPLDDTFTLSSLKMDWSFDGAELISNTSYFDRNVLKLSDYSNYLFQAFTGDPVPGPPLPSYRVQPQTTLDQSSFTQEIRLQSTAVDSRLQWIGGAFFQSADLSSSLWIEDPHLEALMQAVFGLSVEEVLGEALLDGIYSYKVDQSVAEEQIALFGQVDYSITPSLNVTLGIRLAQFSHKYDRSDDGPLNSGELVTQTGKTPTLNAVTPKFALSYQSGEQNLYYLSVAKGVRQGGVNPPNILRSRPGCPEGFSAPHVYGPDNLWSYELGAKNQFADGRLRTSASVFYIRWEDIQREITNNGCTTTSYVDNLGTADVSGAELQAELRANNWYLSLTGGYTHARFTSDTLGSPDVHTGLRPLIASDGDSIGVAPWNVTLSGNYDFKMMGYESYARVDYTYTAKDTGTTPDRDPRNYTLYDPNLDADPAVGLLSARLGVKVGGMDVSLFGRNLLNETPILGTYHTNINDPIYIAKTVRPRTVGISITYPGSR